MLAEIHGILEEENMGCWILFDKIDELYSNDYDKRKKCIESLFRTYLNFVKRAINKFTTRPTTKIDIVSTPNNMLMRRCLNNATIEEYVVNETGMNGEELLLYPNIEETFYTVFAKQVYKGKREAKMVDWLLQRITDGLGGRYPRELINFANYAKEEQKELQSFEENCLISGNAIKKAFVKVSEVKCNTYLSEFPSLKQHFERFQGKDSAKYSREELMDLYGRIRTKRR